VHAVGRDLENNAEHSVTRPSPPSPPRRAELLCSQPGVSVLVRTRNLPMAFEQGRAVWTS
jgi:hypothetical protein